jgi:hypothetical protein
MSGLKWTVVASVATFALMASPASADVLITPPDPVISCGDDISVGVWYQRYSGGSRRLEIAIKSVNGNTVARRTVRASAKWRDYWYTPRCGRRYTVVLRHADWTTKYAIRVEG